MGVKDLLSENEVNMFFSMLQTKNDNIYITTTRYMFTEISLLLELQQEIEAVVGSDGAFALFYHASKEAAKETAQDESFAQMFTGMPFTEQIGFILRIAQFQGWGPYEIAEFREDPFRLVLTNKSTYVRDAYGGKADGPRCYYASSLVDIIDAFVKMAKLDLTLQITETKCKAQGNPHCEWVIEPETFD